MPPGAGFACDCKMQPNQRGSSQLSSPAHPQLGGSRTSSAVRVCGGSRVGYLLHPSLFTFSQHRLEAAELFSCFQSTSLEMYLKSILCSFGSSSFHRHPSAPEAWPSHPQGRASTSLFTITIPPTSIKDLPLTRTASSPATLWGLNAWEKLLRPKPWAAQAKAA